MRIMSLTLCVFFGCGQSLEIKRQIREGCAPVSLNPFSRQSVFSRHSWGRVFQIDPIVASLNFFPNALNEYASWVPLDHLDDSGALSGQYVAVVNGARCNGRYGAYQKNGIYDFAHNQSSFQEVMAYYYGDRFLSAMAPVLPQMRSVLIDAHCGKQDNSYYSQVDDGHSMLRDYVCLGDSIKKPGAYYADDALVLVHELEHAISVISYGESLQQLGYDEAGALSEALSDSMAMVFFHHELKQDFDPKLFSRWALGSFDGSVHVRGAHKCPMYDASYPYCTKYPTFSLGHISYIYPDGLGWPYADTALHPKLIIEQNRQQDQIHNVSLLMSGALWDVFEYAALTEVDFQKLLIDTLKHLPHPNNVVRSPITFINFAKELLDAAMRAGLPSIKKPLQERGLLDMPRVTGSWLALTKAFIEDDASLIRRWLFTSGIRAEFPYSSGGRHALVPNTVVALWFDLINLSDVTAGGVRLHVESSDSMLQFPSWNQGLLPDGSCELMYPKIHGFEQSKLYGLPTFFGTYPQFAASPRTALFIKVSPSAQIGSTVDLRITATPANGESAQVSLKLTIEGAL